MDVRRTNESKNRFRNIVILTGAGISRESGLHTFRDPDGIWAKVNLEDVATPGAFSRNPARVHEFYNNRRQQLVSGTVHPNRAHLPLAELQGSWPGTVTLVTQNIDDLHERAGSANVIHMHGELLNARCTRCHERIQCSGDLTVSSRCSRCGALGTMRPDVVWFGEMPMHMEMIEAALEHADLFISIGTSGNVYPAAGFVQVARDAGSYTVELNLERSLIASSFHEAIYGPATDIVEKYVRDLLKSPE
ncbi:MAG: NAD-dependent deacylase [Bryobacteraceae bacterium]